MREAINLSNYKKDMTVSIFKNLISSIADMRCLETLVLQNNGITDKHIESIEAIFLNRNIIRIDLSRNLIKKEAATYIGKLIQKR